MPLSIVSRVESRVLSMRGASREGLYALASAWQLSIGGNVRPFARPDAQAPSSERAKVSGAATEPLYWPDGPSAA